MVGCLIARLWDRPPAPPARPTINRNMNEIVSCAIHLERVIMFALRLSVAVLIAAGMPAVVRAAHPTGHHAAHAHATTHHTAAVHRAAPSHHAGAKHHSAPLRKSPHHSTPHHPSAPKHIVATPSKPKAIVHHQTRTYRQSQPTTVINRTTNNYYITRNYNRPYRANRAYYHSSHSYYAGKYNWRSSRYSRRHHHHHRHIVRGIVETTSGTPATGNVKIKLLPPSTTRFRYGMAVRIPKNAPLRNYQVNNQTRYVQVTNARGGQKAGAFKDLVQGEPVMILTPRTGNTLAQAIEIFPKKK